MHAMHHPIPIGPMPNLTDFSKFYLAIMIFTMFRLTDPVDLRTCRTYSVVAKYLPAGPNLLRSG